jgi:hypothetical protein
MFSVYADVLMLFSLLSCTIYCTLYAEGQTSSHTHDAEAELTSKVGRYVTTNNCLNRSREGGAHEAATFLLKSYV